MSECELCNGTGVDEKHGISCACVRPKAKKDDEDIPTLMERQAPYIVECAEFIPCSTLKKARDAAALASKREHKPAYIYEWHSTAEAVVEIKWDGKGDPKGESK